MCSGKVLDVEDAGTTDTSNVQQYKWNKSDAQLWMPVISNYGGLEFVSKEDTSKVLEVAKGSTANGANVQILTRNGTDAQRWSITRIG